MTKYRFDSASLCVGFEGIACFDALVIDLEEVAVFFSSDMTSLGKINKYDDDDEMMEVMEDREVWRLNLELLLRQLS